MRWRSTLAAIGCLLMAGTAQAQEVVHFEADSRATQGPQGWVKLLDETGLTSNTTRGIRYLVPTWAGTIELAAFVVAGSCVGCVVEIYHAPGPEPPSRFNACATATLGALDTSATCIVSSHAAAVAPGNPWDGDDVTPGAVMPGNFLIRHSTMSGATGATRLEVWARFQP